MLSNKDTIEKVSVTSPLDEETKKNITEQLFDEQVVSFQDDSGTSEHTDILDETMLKLKDHLCDDMRQNMLLKKWFFGISCTILILITLALINMLDTIMFKYQLPDNSTSFAIQVVTVVSSFITAFMVLPQIIARHLFGTAMQDTFIKLAEQHNKANEKKGQNQNNGENAKLGR